MFGSRVGYTTLAVTMVGVATSGHAQTDAGAVRQLVRECVAQVRQQAMRPENYEFGQPPIWRNFDAYVSPDGRVHNNVKFVGEQDGVYRFEKCLSEHGYSLGPASSNSAPPPPPDKCTQDELNTHPGDCWVKLSPWEKNLALTGFENGWFYEYKVTERQQYQRTGGSQTRSYADFDQSKLVPYFDQLYSDAQNRPIWWSRAFDLALRTQWNPNTKDIPALTAMYRKGEEPLISGYLQKFIGPNKVVVSEFNTSHLSSELFPNNNIQTITLLGVGAEGDNKAGQRFMAALLNIKRCATLIRETDGYKHFRFQTDKEREQSKKTEEDTFYPELKVIIQYPSADEYQQEFFNERNELSATVLLDKAETVCINEGGLNSVKLGELVLDGAVDQNDLSPYLSARDFSNKFINLNQYLIANKLGAADGAEHDPRPGHEYWGLVDAADPTPSGVKRVLTVGAPY